MKNPLGIAAPVQKKIFPFRTAAPVQKKIFPSGPQLPKQITFHGLCHKKGMNKSPDREIFIPLFFASAVGAPFAPVATLLRELLPLRQMLLL